MRIRLFPVAGAALAAAALVSCATSTSRPPILTVELYDSQSVADPAGAEGIAAFVLPVPAVPGAGTAPDPSVSDSSAAAVSAAGSPAVVVGLTDLRAPRGVSRLPLAQPEIPPVSPAPRPAPAPRALTAVPTPSKSGSAPQKAAAQAAAPAATPRVTGSISPAASTSASASANAGAGPAADSYGRLREIYARVGDEMQIGLDGNGFLFLGFPDRQAQADGMSFKTKEIRAGKTWFTFQALKLGTYDLDFLQQDNVSGKSSRETVRVHVLREPDFSAAVSQPPVGGAAPDSGDPAFAVKLTSLGAYEAAVVELLKGYRDGNPSLNDQVAGLYMRMGSYDAAGKYYQKNLSPPGPLADAAVIGLVRVAAAQKDQTGIMAQLSRFLAIRDPDAEEPLILAVRMERDLGQVGMGLDLAAEYAARYPQGLWRDEAEFIAAQSLEMDSPFRDIARARDLYRDVVSRYPVGDFAEAAQGRLQYIERHFYQIR